MEFFDPKEEVLDLQLTQFGRHLLSKGLFKPVYYSFFDDDVVYNSAAGGFSEEQNQAHERIYKATSNSTGSGSPRMKPQISFSSLEKEFLNNYNKTVSGQEKPGDPGQQPTAIKNYALPQPISTIAANKEASPAFDVSVLQGKISSSADYIDLKQTSGGKNTLLIPQLNLEMNVEYISQEHEDFYEFEDASAISFGVVTKNEEMSFFVKVLEQNAPYQKRNFDIEVYEIEEEVSGSNTVENLRQLNFFNIPKWLLSGQKLIEPFFQNGEKTPEISKNNVEYYFDVFVDEEVDEEICRLDPDDFNRGVFANKDNKLCRDVLNQDNKVTYDIYEEEADEPGEVC
jgi:hypothetical protein